MGPRVSRGCFVTHIIIGVPRSKLPWLCTKPCAQQETGPKPVKRQMPLSGGLFLYNSLVPCCSLLAAPPTLLLALGETGTWTIPPRKVHWFPACPVAVVDLKSVCPGVPVRLSRQQHLLINLFIDLLGCTWGFSWEELQTCKLPSQCPANSQTQVWASDATRREWAGLQARQSP